MGSGFMSRPFRVVSTRLSEQIFSACSFHAMAKEQDGNNEQLNN